MAARGAQYDRRGRPSVRPRGPDLWPQRRCRLQGRPDCKSKQVDTLNGGWPLAAGIAFTTRKDNGLAVAAQAALNELIENGTYAKILRFPFQPWRRHLN